MKSKSVAGQVKVPWQRQAEAHLDRGEDDILYVEVGRMEAERVVFGPIDGGER
jgi:hypothetical protein